MSTVSGLVLTAVAGLIFASPAGRLEICPEHPYYFRDGERHVVLVGVSDRAALAIWENAKGFSWRKYLDELSRHHINYVRQDVCSWGGLRDAVVYPAQFSNPAWPFPRTGPGDAVDGRPRFDLTRVDPSYFEERLKPFLRETARRGIYVELTLFEGFRRRSFADSVYADANNVHGLGLQAGQVTSDAALDNPRLRDIQERFVDRVLEATAGFGHVIYEIANETGGKRWVTHFVDYIHRHPTHPGRLVSAGEQTTAFDPRRGPNDIVVKHRGGGGVYAGNDGIASHHRALLEFRVGKPVTHNEYFLFANRSTADVHFIRKMMWGDFTAGGHSNFYDFVWWRGTGRSTGDGEPSRTPPREILRGAQHLLDFLSVNRVRFWTLSPDDSLVRVVAGGSSPRSRSGNDAQLFTLAEAGVEYLSYVLGDGPVTVTLKLEEEPYAARWYDPKTGRFLTAKEEFPGVENARLVSPDFEQDAVLWVRRAASSGSTPHERER